MSLDQMPSVRDKDNLKSLDNFDERAKANAEKVS